MLRAFLVCLAALSGIHLQRVACRRSATSTIACNGSPELCELRVNEVTFFGDHNTAATRLLLYGSLDKISECVVDNHFDDVVKGLELGKRFFDVDACMTKDGNGNADLVVCHGPAKGIPFSSLFRSLYVFLNDPFHRGEVVVLSFNDADPGEDHSQEAKNNMTRLMAGMLEEHLGRHLLLRSDFTDTWPTLGDLVAKNTRVIALWGRRLGVAMYKMDKANASRAYRGRYTRWYDFLTNTWKSDYGRWSTDDLCGYLSSFCRTPLGSTTPSGMRWPAGNMILADAYLTLGKVDYTRPAAVCNIDHARDANAPLLGSGDPSESALVAMQQQCWVAHKQVAFVAMDYANSAGPYETPIGINMNERNIAFYGWIGGVIETGSTVAAPGGCFRSKNSPSADDFKRLLACLGTLSSSTSRIQVDSVTDVHTSGRTRVEFTVQTSPGRAFDEASNSEVLFAIKQASTSNFTKTGVYAVFADCGPPSSTTNGVWMLSSLGTVEGAVVEYECQWHYSLHGSRERVCGADGVWSGSQPMCIHYSTTLVHAVGEAIHQMSATMCLFIALGGLGCCCALCCCTPRIYDCCLRRVRLGAARIIFTKFDKDGSGFVSIDEVKREFDSLNVNKDNKVDFEEFKVLVDRGEDDRKKLCC